MSHRRSAVTIRDVAREAGVSVATVSRTLNGLGSVDPALAAKVHQAVNETGYTPNQAGRALRRQRVEAWAVILPDLNRFFTGVVAAFESAAIARGFSVLLCNTAEDLARERQYIRTMVAQQLAGVVVAVTSETESDLQPLFDAGIPVVLVDRSVAGFECDSVFLDNELAGRLAAEHLLAQGFTRFACIGTQESIPTVAGRMRGYCETVAAAGYPVEPAMIRRVPLDAGHGRVAMRSLLADPNPPTALYATTGPLAVGAYEGLADSGMIGQVALVCHDDDEWTQLVRPAITVVAQPMPEIGAIAAELLAARLEDPTMPPRHVVLPPSLIVRESSLRSR